MMEKRFIKVYRIKINYKALFYKAAWYSKHPGEEFEASLWIKDCAGAVLPCFVLLAKEEGEYKAPTIIRSVRPEDCTIIWEEVYMVDKSLYEFLRRRTQFMVHDKL